VELKYHRRARRSSACKAWLMTMSSSLNIRTCSPLSSPITGGRVVREQEVEGSNPFARPPLNPALTENYCDFRFKNLSRLVQQRLVWLLWEREAKSHFGRTLLSPPHVIEQLLAVAPSHFSVCVPHSVINEQCADFAHRIRSIAKFFSSKLLNEPQELYSGSCLILEFSCETAH
jgi:hypothetical protein